MDQANKVATERDTQVRVSLTELEKAISVLEEAANRLDKRLSTVLRVPPPVGMDDGVEHETRVPLAEEISLHASKVEYINGRLGSFLDRMEL